MLDNISPDDWQIQKMCIDIDDYELSVEKQKTNWNCDQTRESWKWVVAFHGSILSSGSSNSPQEAQEFALKNLPLNKDD